MSQDSLTVYPFSGDNVRTMAVIISDFMYMQDDLRKADGMLAWCDSIREAQVVKIEQQEIKLSEKDNIIVGLDKIIEFKDEQLTLTEEQGKQYKRQKNLFIGTTGLTTLLLIIILL